MAELIEKEKAIAAINRMVQLPDSARVQAMGAVSLVKAVDAVEVVRCKDCRHNKPTVDAKGNPSCRCNNVAIGFYGWLMDDKDFCPYGERKVEDGKNQP